MSRRILITGGRKNYDYKTVEIALTLTFKPGDVLVHGAANGIDLIGQQWAEYYNHPFEAYPADWDKFQKAAGAERNQRMLDTGIDLALIFKGNNGTADMKNKLSRAGVEMISYEDFWGARRVGVSPRMF